MRRIGFANGQISLMELDGAEQSEPPDLLQEENIFDDIGESAEPVEDDESDATAAPYVKWTDEYKQAREFLFGTGNIAPDFEKDSHYCKLNPKMGMCLLFLIWGECMQTVLVEIDTKKAQQYYAKLLMVLNSPNIENLEVPLNIASVKCTPGFGYRAREVLQRSKRGRPGPRLMKCPPSGFAKRQVRNISLRNTPSAVNICVGKAEQSDEKAFELYLRSAKQGFPLC